MRATAARQLGLWPAAPGPALVLPAPGPTRIGAPATVPAPPGSDRRRGLDRAPLRAAPAPGAPGRLPTGLPALDAFLGGGLPRGQITEVCGGPSSGKATLALAACLQAIAARGAAAWIDAGARFWPLAALEAGAPADRLLVVRAPGDATAWRAADILLGASGAVDLVVVDLAGRASPGEGRVTRLHRLAERGGAALVVLDGRPAESASLGALVALRLHVRHRDAGAAACLEIGVARNKRGPDGRVFLEPLHAPDRLRLSSTL